MRHGMLFTIMATLLLFTAVACEREPLLHLYDEGNVDLELPVVDLDLQVYWDYEMSYGIHYDWRAEWFYGWDEEDKRIFGEMGYTTPNVFNLRRYYTGEHPNAHHTSVLPATVYGTHFRGSYDWGYWDILCWNQVVTIDGVQSLIFDEETSLDSVTARTNPGMQTARYQAPKYTRAFYEPEPLFAAYDPAIEINRNLDGFTFDSERNVWVRKLDMLLMPVTYIYLTQVILHHNRGRVVAVDGTSNFSGMARSTTLNTGVAGNDAITVNYYSRLKNGCMKHDEVVDIVGGRLLTFGICGINANRIDRAEQVHDPNSHYMDLVMQFNNGMDSTFVFDITSQVRQRYKGGVITVELDMDTVPIPQRSGGSGFDTVVKDFEDGGTHEFEM